MDLQTSVFLLFSLCTAGHSLSCYDCSLMTCSNPKIYTCHSGYSKCMSSITVGQAGFISVKKKAKECAADCLSGSMNFGIIKYSSVCCNTDGCNLQDPPDPSTSTPNGKTCYSCDGKSCLNILSCTGTEDRCIKATGTFVGKSLVVKGCVSKSICDAAASVGEVQGASCCSGNLCNGAQSVSQSFLFLCCSLLSFILLH
ncbi:urokinase plasminogen activator surface receptor-like [Carassius gibelio]|uniref:urokinase plasminogen activator surface receptor-like n=1 Tax=Carassius gibelio TaxID=101364 RepID=UPI002277FE2F|nr:urokinase plasminogen activator surface receptor-like [Carassius gibelio]